MLVHKMTKDNLPKMFRAAWFWRERQGCWEIAAMSDTIEDNVGRPELAYTHWCELVKPPVPDAP